MFYEHVKVKIGILNPHAYIKMFSVAFFVLKGAFLFMRLRACKEPCRFDNKNNDLLHFVYGVIQFNLPHRVAYL